MYTCMTNTYRIITEGDFSYVYTADDASHAITKWLRATFVSGCTASQPTLTGRFIVTCPAGKNAAAMTVAAKITKE